MAIKRTREQINEAGKILEWCKRLVSHRHANVNSWIGPRRVFMAWKGTGENGRSVVVR